MIGIGWSRWAPRYRKIAEKLGIREEDDIAAAHALNALLPFPDLDSLKRIVGRKACIVFGAGPSLDEDLMTLSLKGWFKKVIISADGATTAVLKYGRPDIIVTDLDGDIRDQLEAWERGAWMVVHAHGDNLRKVEEVVPKLGTRVIGTTQTKPFGKLFNFGGFTDGDRAAFLAWALGASKIYLAGMDLGKAVGKYSGEKDYLRKILKLEICGELLSWLATLGAKVVNLTSGGEDIPNIPRRRV
ncbi:MAG: 6-hydroxymethylpterin diphosphokinase MptE-like protein [Candidatus Hadarchaeales archaeon]